MGCPPELMIKCCIIIQSDVTGNAQSSIGAITRDNGRELTGLTCHRLKALNTFGNCQRPVFSLGVSPNMHKLTNLCKFGLNNGHLARDN